MVSNYVVLAGLKYMVLLPEFPLCWDYRFDLNKHFPDFIVLGQALVLEAFIFTTLSNTPATCEVGSAILLTSQMREQMFLKVTQLSQE